jgi:hypothetical protein
LSQNHDPGQADALRATAGLLAIQLLATVWWNMRTAIAVALSITLAIYSPFVTAQTAAPDPRVDQVDRLISLTKSLVKGVDQCFNSSHTKGNTAVKDRLTKLETTAVSTKSNLTSGDAAKVAQSAAELKVQWEAFSEKAPLAARFHCNTQRKCMELGFEGHANYPHCQPVNGNKHANIQYIQFQELLRVLPQLVDGLSPRS